MASSNSKQYFRVLLLALLLHLISGDCIDLDLGMESGKIKDKEITVSSATAQAGNGRLNSMGSWCATTSDSKPFLQIDLQTLHIICAVSTQGNPQADQWVETYTLQLSTDGKTWTNFTEFGQTKNFTGNNDRNTEKKNILLEGVLARGLRFIGKTSNGRFCMRTEAFGVKFRPENLAAGKTTKQSSTCCDGEAAKAVDGNADTEYGSGHCSHTKENNPSWWRVDLGSDHVPVSEVQIVNRFSVVGGIQNRSKDYKITLGTDLDVTRNPECVGRYTFIQFIASAVCYRNPLKTGRYLGIMTTKKQVLHLCEVEVYSRDNLAFNKNTAQVSTSGPYSNNLAVDGNSNTNIVVGKSCTHTSPETKPWWRVDLGQVEPVTEVYIVNRGDCCGFRLNPFEIRVGTNSSDGGITNPKCGDGGYSVPQGKGASFFCRPSLYGRYVTIRITKSDQTPLTLCEVEVYSARRACPIQSLGLISSYTFPDSSFSASTSRTGNPASEGRLNGNGAWSPSTNGNSSDYLQINLQNEFFICAVATQGSSTADHWTTKYKLLLSLNNTDWITYQENNADKVFNANDGRNDIVKHMLVGIHRARFIRFQPTNHHNGKALRVEVYGLLKPAGPSQAPASFNVTSLTSTSVFASWQLPPANSTYGTIIEYKLLYRKNNSSGAPFTVITIGSNSTSAREVTGLGKYTEYEFQVLASSSVGNGPSSVQFVRTKEDAPTAPGTPSSTPIAPNGAHGPRIDISWSRPQPANGIIRNYIVSYSHSLDRQSVQTKTFEADTLNFTVDVLGGVNYEFFVRAVTIKSGESVSLSLDTQEYAPSVGPDNVVTSELKEGAFNISWAPLSREKSYGKVIQYEVNGELIVKKPRSRRSIASSKVFNTSETFAVLYDLAFCSQYNLSVRAYTSAGPGPYGQHAVLQTSGPVPRFVTVVNSRKTEVSLKWQNPLNTPREGIRYMVLYTGTKAYNKTFSHGGSIDADKATNYTVKDLFPGTLYIFTVYGVSDCGDSLKVALEVDTDVANPLEPEVKNEADKSVSEPIAVIQLWPTEQRNGPISAYQVIVLKVEKGDEVLSPEDAPKLTDANTASKSNLNFYIAAEINNDPVREAPWEFTVGDKKNIGGYVNSALQKGQVYIIYQRAISPAKNGSLVGKSKRVAKISVTKDIGVNDKTKESGGSLNTTAVIVPVVLLLLVIPAVIAALLFYRRRKRSQKQSDKAHVQLDDIGSGSPRSTTSTANLVYEDPKEMVTSAKADNQVYQNFKVSDKAKPGEQIYQNTKKDTEGQHVSQVYQNVTDIHNGKDTTKAPPLEVKEPVYSEAEDGKPKPIPSSKFVAYFKSKSSNGAALLRQEFKDLSGGMLSTWDCAKNNKIKNRYGNIVTYDHSRVVLEKIEGNPKSDYINASYIPTYDEKTMCYIATQGPNKVTTNDFWRMIWQENCTTIVMLTNTIEQGKVKCEQYWPDSTSQFGAITVTTLKTETFADYLIRTFILVKGSEKREVLQYHYITWPDRGVPHHSTALLAFRWKVHVRHQLIGGPLVVHCSAGVGRTGTFIGIDAMLESAKKQNNVFIHNYVQVMRRQRPHMIQKEEQYVFLHQAVMEALVCGNTEIAPHDLLIRMNKLARVHKASKQTGYAQEFESLQLLSEADGSENGSKAASKPANINKNRFPDIVPLDSARLFLKSSDPDKDYINASFVDDYIQRNAYVLTQAPLDNSIDDFWRMVSQYDIGTVVMLNSLKEGKEVYPRYWPSAGVVKYGKITVEMLSESTANNITTRKFGVLDAEPPKKKSTVQHLQFTGWSDPNSCPDPQEIIQLLTTIQKSQQQTGNGVIVFQCSDGVGRSGVVSTIMSTIERIKNEQTVDVLQTVNLIRVKRPGAVANVDQYKFCYKAIQVYLDSFNGYSNFAHC